MTSLVTVLDKDIFTVSNLFTPEECRQLIDKGEAMGFEAASIRLPDGAQMMPNVRNNDRAIYHDPEFAHAVWERVRAFVPPQIEGCRATGLYEEFRFYRYDPGQRFKRHKDGYVETERGERSSLSFLIYLNTDYEGGETIFRDYTYENDTANVHEIRIVPEVGMGLFFVHERKHEGSAVISGRKYLLRTDVLYEATRSGSTISGF
ncbi:MAG TPA: 2OG-Fe(II) oxygenase [Chthonomonadaceae bacterium]|nr:2OG-Fe(II) oxygenase [Chthonomonadaceae bacterium]